MIPRPAVSVVVPVYVREKEDLLFLDRLLDSLGEQTFDDFELVISEQGVTAEVEQMLAGRPFPVKLTRLYRPNGNTPANTNNAIRASRGRIIKPMHQDDFFLREDALAEVVESQALWGGLGFQVADANDNLVGAARKPDLLGSFGPPSVSFFQLPNNGSIFYDERFRYFNDHDMHQRLLRLYGKPYVGKGVSVAIRQHPGQDTHRVGSEIIDKEKRLLRKKQLRIALDEGKLGRSFVWLSPKNGLQKPLFLGPRRVISVLRRTASSAWDTLKSEVAKESLPPGIGYVLTQRASSSIEKIMATRVRGTLLSLSEKYGSDKGSQSPEDGLRYGPRLHYSTVYQAFFEKKAGQVTKLLEIGFGAGASAKVWEEYFPNAQVNVIDIEDKTVFNSTRLKVHVGDQTDKSFLREFVAENGPFDVIIDDGGHMMGQQQISLGVLFHALAPGGHYFIEDLHTSFWPWGEWKDLYGFSLDISENRDNTTHGFLTELIRTGESHSQFLSEAENRALEGALDACMIFSLPDTSYGPNRLGMLRKR